MQQLRFKTILTYFIVSVLFGACTSNNKDYHESGKQYYFAGQYENALSKLKLVSSNYEHFDDVTAFIKLCDSMIVVRNMELEELNRIEREKAQVIKLKELKETIITELESDTFTKGINSKSFRGSIDKLTLELILFSMWTKIIDESQSSNDKEIIKLGNQLKNKVKQVQLSEFPKMRKEYGAIMNNLVRESGGKVKVYATKNKTIKFIARDFALSQNIKKAQESLVLQLIQFRFNQVQYSSSDYSDELTNYTFPTPDDGELYRAIN